MAQLIVRNLEDDVRDRLQNRARENGRSMEEEAREILRGAVLSRPAKGVGAGLGSRMARRFAKAGLKGPVAEFKGRRVDLPDFGK